MAIAIVVVVVIAVEIVQIHANCSYFCEYPAAGRGEERGACGRQRVGVRLEARPDLVSAVVDREASADVDGRDAVRAARELDLVRQSRNAPGALRLQRQRHALRAHVTHEAVEARVAAEQLHDALSAVGEIERDPELGCVRGDTAADTDTDAGERE